MTQHHLEQCPFCDGPEHGDPMESLACEKDAEIRRLTAENERLETWLTEAYLQQGYPLVEANKMVHRVKTLDTPEERDDE